MAKYDQMIEFFTFFLLDVEEMLSVMSEGFVGLLRFFTYIFISIFMKTRHRGHFLLDYHQEIGNYQCRLWCLPL